MRCSRLETIYIPHLVYVVCAKMAVDLILLDRYTYNHIFSCSEIETFSFFLRSIYVDFVTYPTTTTVTFIFLVSCPPLLLLSFFFQPQGNLKSQIFN